MSKEIRDLLYEQKIAYNVSHQLTVETLAGLHKQHGQLLAERQCRKEIERLERERQKIQQEKVTVQEVPEEEIWLEAEDDVSEIYEEEDPWRDEPYEILKERLLEEKNEE